MSMLLPMASAQAIVTMVSSVVFACVSISANPPLWRAMMWSHRCANSGVSLLSSTIASPSAAMTRSVTSRPRRSWGRSKAGSMTAMAATWPARPSAGCRQTATARAGADRAGAASYGVAATPPARDRDGVRLYDAGERGGSRAAVFGEHGEFVCLRRLRHTRFGAMRSSDCGVFAPISIDRYSFRARFSSTP
jgi:hypothetical protein